VFKVVPQELLVRMCSMKRVGRQACALQRNAFTLPRTCQGIGELSFVFAGAYGPGGLRQLPGQYSEDPLFAPKWSRGRMF
jgi:hypothetical protein